MPIRLPPIPHRWALSPREAIAVQRRLAARLRLEPSGREFRWIAGLDAAFAAGGRTCVAAVVLWDLEAREPVEWRVARRPVRFPYIPGLLSFREAPALLAALRKLSRLPDLLMCDGHGRAHPRRFGIACHLGLLCGRPSLGCAKSVLIGEHSMPGSRRGSAADLKAGDEKVGEAIRTRDGGRPVYVSPGHGLDQAEARRMVLVCGMGHRLPEPIWLADRLVARAKREACGWENERGESPVDGFLSGRLLGAQGEPELVR